MKKLLENLSVSLMNITSQTLDDLQTEKIFFSVQRQMTDTTMQFTINDTLQVCSMQWVFYFLPITMHKQPKWYGYLIELDEVRRLNPDLTMQDVMFIWEAEAQKQCDAYEMSMYKRTECIARSFSSYL